MTTKTRNPKTGASTSARPDRDPLKWGRSVDVAEMIIANIKAGRYEPGDELPSVRELTAGAGDGAPMAMVTATAVNRLVQRSGLVRVRTNQRAVVLPQSEWPKGDPG